MLNNIGYLKLMKFDEELICHALLKFEPFKAEVKDLFGIELTT